MTDASPWTIDVTTANFQAAVIDRSAERPVVVDFWAEWCAPCRQLTPILERLVQEAGGRLVLAKVNIEESPELAQAFMVQQIPFVVAIRDGQPVNYFLGALPEAEIREWLKSVLPSPVDELVERGRTVEEQDPAAAEALYRQAAELDPQNDAIRIHLARALLARGHDDECREILVHLESRGYLEPEAERIKSQLELREAAAEAGGVEEARRAAAAAPDDLSLQLKLVDALAVAGKHREALDICLSLIERDKHGIGPQAKETMVRIFDTLGPGSELAGTYRRRLATAWY